MSIGLLSSIFFMAKFIFDNACDDEYVEGVYGGNDEVEAGNG